MTFSKGFLKDLRRTLRGFLWKGRGPQAPFQTLELPKSKGGMGLLPTEVHASAIQASWWRDLTRNPHPPWISLGLGLLQHHLQRTSTFDLLTLLDMTVKPRVRREAPRFWKSLLEIWYKLREDLKLPRGQHQFPLSLPIECALQDRETGSPLRCTAEMKTAGIRCLQDLVRSNSQDGSYSVFSSLSPIHRRLGQQLDERTWELTLRARAFPLRPPSDPPTTILHPIPPPLITAPRSIRDRFLLLLPTMVFAGQPLPGYRARNGRLCQQETREHALHKWTDISSEPLSYKLIHHPALMPKVSSLLWRIHYASPWTGVRLHRAFPDRSPYCPRCPTVEEDVLHRFVHCPPVTRLWREVMGMFPVPSPLSPSPDMVLFQLKDLQGLGKHERILIHGCALWAIHMAHTRLLFSPDTRALDLIKTWKSQLHRCLVAKARTARIRGSEPRFRSRWARLICWMTEMSQGSNWSLVDL